MTSRNMNRGSKCVSKQTKPFLLKPVGKNYLWGGNRLNDIYLKNIDLYPLAETWECSTHPNGSSIVASGEFSGRELREVLDAHPEFVGTNPKTEHGLPVLIKLIDAREDLSVQVHPDDDYARMHENGALGKSEMWYVLDAEMDAKLVYGFCHDMDKQTIRNSIEDGTVEKYLQKVPIQRGDVFFVPAGRVHAIGKGTLIAEIQENSNLTYRLYDYGRQDKDGKSRPLHIEKALDVLDLKNSVEPRQPMRTFQFKRGQAVEQLCSCRSFRVARMLINTEHGQGMAEIQTGGHSFQVILCTEGQGELFWGSESLKFYPGDCIFIPANSMKIQICGKIQMLKVEC